jgi:hypothetical protein
MILRALATYSLKASPIYNSVILAIQKIYFSILTTSFSI